MLGDKCLIKNISYRNTNENNNLRTNNNLTVQAEELIDPVFGFSVSSGQGCGAVSFPRQLIKRRQNIVR